LQSWNEARGGSNLGQSVEIEGREYKLLLDAGRFKGAPDNALAGHFWNDQLKPIVESELGPEEDGGSRAGGELKLKKSRIVVFHDTKDRLLSKRGFALRKRTFVADGVLVGEPEITLKFRTPDVLLAGGYHDATKRSHDTTLEEDIAPLQASQKGKAPVVSFPLVTYSRFSVSSEIHGDVTVATVGDLFSSFPVSRDSLEQGADSKLPLIPGPTIAEWVFQHANVRLGKSLQADFALSLWYFLEGSFNRRQWKLAEGGKMLPRIAEISFDFEIEDEPVRPATAARALKLFAAMQKALPVDTGETSKTVLALP